MDSIYLSRVPGLQGVTVIVTDIPKIKIIRLYYYFYLDLYTVFSDCLLYNRFGCLKMTQGFDGDGGNERSKSFGGTGSQSGRNFPQ